MICALPRKASAPSRSPPCSTESAERTSFGSPAATVGFGIGARRLGGGADAWNVRPVIHTVGDVVGGRARMPRRGAWADREHGAERRSHDRLAMEDHRHNALVL